MSCVDMEVTDVLPRRSAPSLRAANILAATRSRSNMRSPRPVTKKAPAERDAIVVVVAASNSDAPDASLPCANTLQCDMPNADAPCADMPDTNPSDTNKSEANKPESVVSNDNASHADASHVDASHADASHDNTASAVNSSPQPSENSTIASKRPETGEDLAKWCDYMAKNGIVQHSDLWLAVKRFTIGGSSISVLMGLNAFQSVRDLLASKLGLVPFGSDIKPQWGNMLEETIKCEMEHIHGCTIYGEDLYITGHIYGTSYSPDGLAVIGDKLVLLEFKCPYNRIPGREPPKYYVPQVKMGLELINPRPDYGLYAEAVYRRCMWEDLGPNGNYDTTLVAKPSKSTPPISYGFVGFYTTHALIEKTREEIRAGKYKYPAPPVAKGTIDDFCDDDFDEPEPSQPPNDPLLIPGFEKEYGEFEPQCYDLGASTPDVFRRLMHALDTGRMVAHYSEIIREKDPRVARRRVNAELAKFTKKAAANDWVLYGIVPWKLLRIEQHIIDYEEGYLNPYVEDIKSIVDFVKSVTDKGFTKRELWSKIDAFMDVYNQQNIVEYDDF